MGVVTFFFFCKDGIDAGLHLAEKGLCLRTLLHQRRKRLILLLHFFFVLADGFVPFRNLGRNPLCPKLILRQGRFKTCNLLG